MKGDLLTMTDCDVSGEIKSPRVPCVLSDRIIAHMAHSTNSPFIISETETSALNRAISSVSPIPMD